MKYSAGIIVYRSVEAGGPDHGSRPETVELLLVHPGGPFWANKDDHAWSIPKGEYLPTDEDPSTAAEREFTEELGLPVPQGERIELPAITAGRKEIRSWLVEGDLDPATISSNETEIEWPPRSGKVKRIPEIDRAEWVPIAAASTKLHKGQVPLVAHIQTALGT